MNRIGVSVVGCGWMGAALLRRFVADGRADVVAVCEPDRQRAVDVLTELGLPAGRHATDFQTMLDNPAVEAVCLVSPNVHHGAQSIAALEAGKHVFCEKPAATRYFEFRREVELDRARRRQVTMVDYILSFHDLERQLGRMIADGTFGELTHLQINYRHPINSRGDKAWKLQRAVVGDAIGMGIVHALHQIVQLMSSQARPVAVLATSRDARLSPFEIPPAWNILIRFDNGATGVCLGDIDAPTGYDFSHGVHGTAGSFLFDSTVARAEQVRYWSAEQTGGRWVRPLDGARCRAEQAEHLAWPESATTPSSGDIACHRVADAVGHFLDCIEAGRKSPLGFADSAVAAEIGWAAMMSASLRREIELPLKPEESEPFFEALERHGAAGVAVASSMNL
jgi:predicted dehydrogenase